MQTSWPFVEREFDFLLKPDQSNIIFIWSVRIVFVPNKTLIEIQGVDRKFKANESNVINSSGRFH